ncbi:MAG TPA: hypothetical protein VGP26_23845 [Actinophytocola sp.]|jgi:hypothetical protein|nr:hypothetical protein [Actinophytocola sp.]
MTMQGTPPPGFPLAEQQVYGNGTHPAIPRDEARDDTTRYLCAAAHLDPDFANSAIREFLVEETRPVATSVGVDATAVLGEAVAARTRRKLRDVALLVLLVGMLFVAPVALLGGWVVLGVLVSVRALTRAVQKQGLQAKGAVYVVGGLVLVGLLVILWPLIEDLLSSVSNGSGSYATSSAYPYGVLPTSGSRIGDSVLTVLAVSALLAVLLADRLVVWKHLNERFWPNRAAVGSPGGPALAGPFARVRDRAVFRFSPDRFLTQLRRYVDARATAAGPLPHEEPAPGRPAPLIVYRDFVPFVGAGKPEDPWSIAVPLEELPDAEPGMELTTESLYAGIGAEIESLRAATTLSPGRRLRQLNVGERVIVSADELIDHLADRSAADFLARPGVAPFTMLRPARVRSIKADPVEWARYYQCFQVETWDRDLVVSVFVHVAVGQGALYVEWTPCVLRPIRRRYREIDRMSRSLWRPLLGSVLDLLRLPLSIPGRLVHTLSFIRPVRHGRDVIDPDVYGVATSLRELASAQRVDNYFQFADIERYLKMMESRLILAVSRTMRAAGYSPASFDEQAATVVNNNVSIADNHVNVAGSVAGNVVAGTGNKVAGNSRRPTSRG